MKNSIDKRVDVLLKDIKVTWLAIELQSSS